jgi:hypothetical protein
MDDYETRGLQIFIQTPLIHNPFIDTNYYSSNVPRLLAFVSATKAEDTHRLHMCE